MLYAKCWPLADLGSDDVRWHSLRVARAAHGLSEKYFWDNWPNGPGETKSSLFIPTYSSLLDMEGSLEITTSTAGLLLHSREQVQGRDLCEGTEFTL